jgi:hypothetical protein
VREFDKFFPSKWFTTPVNAKATLNALKELHKLTQKWAEARSKRAESSTPRLLTFSEWLADFDSTQYSLEVPGQYGGSSRGPPREDLHSKIIRYYCFAYIVDTTMMLLRAVLAVGSV